MESSTPSAEDAPTAAQHTDTHISKALLALPFIEPILSYEDYYDAANDAEPLGAEIITTLRAVEKSWNSTTFTDVAVGSVALPQDDAWVSVGGQRLSFPLSLAEAESLYSSGKLSASFVGVENVGTVLDATVRQSKEYVLHPDTDLCPVLQSFEGTEVPTLLQTKLCPSADSVTITPYKLIAYGPGDFFQLHCDSMDRDSTMIGSLAVQVPVVGGQQQVSGGGGREEGAPAPGSLVLYVGRSVASSMFSETKKVELMGNGYNTDCPPFNGATTDESQLRYTVDLTSTSTSAVGEGMVEIKYAGWYGDVPHEVTRVEQGVRLVLIYKLFRNGRRLGYLPHSLVTETEAQLALLFRLLEAGPQPERFVGCLLRHKYPPAGLHSSMLKGVDAMVHQLARRQYRTTLLTATEIRSDYPGNPFRLKSADPDDAEGNWFRRRLFATGSRNVERDMDLTSVRAPRNVTTQHPGITKTVWVQVGLGQLVGGGSVYGNWDCGTDWWYRAAVLIIHPEPSMWLRCRPLFLGALKGGKDGAQLKRLYDLEFVWKIVCSFA